MREGLSSSSDRMKDSMSISMSSMSGSNEDSMIIISKQELDQDSQDEEDEKDSN